MVNTRPDLAYSVDVVSRFMEAPTVNHMAAVKQILRYIRGTIHLGCHYGRKEEEEPRIVGYSDSDHAGDLDDRKSTSGVLYFLGTNPVTWVSQKQNVVATSSCEAEYIAAAITACQGIWLSWLLGELMNKEQQKKLMKREQQKVLIKVDNKSAIALCKNSVHHDRSKHIDVRYHFIRECIEEGRVTVEHIRTGDQLADILTKPLARVKFLELREHIGLRAVKKQD